MAAISRANELKQLLPGLNALFGEEYNRYENEHEEIYVTENSERSFEEELKLSGFGAAPVKDEGSAINYDTAQESFVARYTHETIGLGFSITEEAMEDNLYVSVSARYTKALARAMSYTKQVKAAYPLNNGFSTAFSSGDGVALFSTAHPLVNGGTNRVIPEGYSVNHYLTDTNAFFITTDVPDGMKHFVRAPMTTTMDGDFDTGNVRYKARERYSFGVSDPLGIFGSPGSS
jgi:hypothetical protein